MGKVNTKKTFKQIEHLGDFGELFPIIQIIASSGFYPCLTCFILKTSHLSTVTTQYFWGEINLLLSSRKNGWHWFLFYSSLLIINDIIPWFQRSTCLLMNLSKWYNSQWVWALGKFGSSLISPDTAVNFLAH